MLFHFIHFHIITSTNISQINFDKFQTISFMDWFDVWSSTIQCDWLMCMLLAYRFNDASAFDFFSLAHFKWLSSKSIDWLTLIFFIYASIFKRNTKVWWLVACNHRHFHWSDAHRSFTLFGVLFSIAPLLLLLQFVLWKDQTFFLCVQRLCP